MVDFKKDKDDKESKYDLGHSEDSSKKFGPHVEQPIAKPVEPPKAEQLPAEKAKADKAKAEKAEAEKKADKVKCMGQIQDILKEYNNLESTIPLQHEYWSLVNKYRGL